MPLDPEIAAFLESQRKLPPRGSMSVAETRDFMRQRIPLAGEPAWVESVEDRSIAGVPCRIYTPRLDEDTPTVIFFHGGRFFSGDLDTHDPLCRDLAAQSGCKVIAVDYRLAPEHAFPAAVEDALAVVRGTQGTVAVAGDSAGGNLAAVVAQQERGRLACQVLIYPMLDARCGTRSYADFSSGYGPGAEDMKRGYQEYLPLDTNVEDPLISPLMGDLTGLPPAFVLTAEYDTLRDEGEQYAARIKATHVRYDGMIHGFLQLGAVVAAARDAISDCAEFLRDTFDLPLHLPITDTLDLHSVPPRDVKAVVEEYLAEAHARGFLVLRIIHGRGIGVQREAVRAVLARTSFVHSFGDAPAEAGGWGATVVTLATPSAWEIRPT